ncbi:MAG: hypothetical protein H8D97_01835, partial [Proteobacteria bacterium]|nr:hypothetical protein [Pseudomonadota bacterium]
MADNNRGLFSGVFGKKDKSVPVDDLIARIDTAIDNLNVKSNANTPDEDALITKSITDLLVPPSEDNGESNTSSVKNILDDELKSAGLDPIFKDMNVSEERLKKYEVYDTIYSNVQIVKKVISVYLDNIFQKDPISNQVLLVKESDKD